MQVELEKIINSLKGVAGILSAMSEAPAGNRIWQEWGYQLLHEVLCNSIEALEAICVTQGEDDSRYSSNNLILH